MNAIYLHGFLSGPSSKKALFFRGRFAERGIDLRVPDLEEGGFENLTLSSQLRVVNRVIGELGSAVLMGSSMGGYLAALAAASNTAITRVVCLAPAFDFANRWRHHIGDAALREWQASGQLSLFHYAHNRQVRASWQLYEDALNHEPYPIVQQPVLVLHGRRDDLVPLEVPEEFVHHNPRAILRPLDSDHELLDVLDELWEETWRFLNQ
jgi:pimeloyl-ACP methyl ester carboxylesterase